MKKILLYILIASIVFTTSCWDKVEIDSRVFPYSIGIDLNHDEEGKNFLINFSYPNINAIGEEADSETKSFIVSDKGDNIFDAIHQLTDRMQKPIYLKHLRVVIISEEVARDREAVKGIIDGLSRDYLINKMVDLVVTKGSTKRFTRIKSDSKRQESLAGPIHEILRNEQKSTKFTPRTLNSFIKDMEYSSVSRLPLGNVLDKENEITLEGAGIFKDYQLIGYIDARENKNLDILEGKADQDGIDIDFKGGNLSILMTNTKSKKKLVDKKDLKIEYNIEIEGQLHQYYMHDKSGDEESNKLLQEMEKVIEETIEEDLLTTINRIQNNIKVDLLGISKYLHKFYPGLWENLKEDWDSIFPNIDIKPKVEFNIRRRGLIR